LLKLACGGLPETDPDLASQPTIPRMENAPDGRACLRIARALGELYVRERGKGGAPKRVLLDFDSTDDPTHGGQEGSYYHGYYGQHMYHPLVVLDGESGQLVSAVLRAGNTHAGRGAVAVLKRVAARLKEAWPGVGIEIRADAGFAPPAVYEWCEEEGIGYTIGLISNPRLEALAEPLLERAPSGRPRRWAGRRSGWSPRPPTGRAAGAASEGWSARPRSSRRGRTPDSW
jgi:hypothetical protein